MGISATKLGFAGTEVEDLFHRRIEVYTGGIVLLCSGIVRGGWLRGTPSLLAEPRKDAQMNAGHVLELGSQLLSEISTPIHGLT